MSRCGFVPEPANVSLTAYRIERSQAVGEKIIVTIIPEISTDVEWFIDQ
jgi:hypothetical protein